MEVIEVIIQLDKGYLRSGLVPSCLFSLLQKI